METPRPDSDIPIYSDSYKDIYFCEEDGLAEGDHVFLKGNRLPEAWQDREEFIIAETGFGTGLNFLASWLKWEETTNAQQHLTYISFEKFPLTPDQIRTALTRWQEQLKDKLDIMLANYPPRISGWHNIYINKNITLLLIFDDVNRALPELNAQVDAWFLDGFAPAKNPEMWNETVFSTMAENSHAGTTVASFTAAGLVKNGLRAVGFHIAKSRGFGRKRDMIYGHFLGERTRRSRKRIKSVAVLGGGLAGAHLASRLLKHGLEVDLYEERGIASGASGNQRGLFNPRFTAARNTVSDFYASAFATALRQFRQLENIEYQECGSLHLFTDAEKEKRLRGTAQSWDWHSDHIRIVDAKEASNIAGIKIEQNALFLPDAGFVSPAKVCEVLSQDVNVITEKVEMLLPMEGGWQINGKFYEAAIIASGVGMLNFEQAKSLPCHTVRGQVVYASQTAITSSLKTNLCYGGYCSAPSEGMHAVGATFQPWLKDTDTREEDSAEILANFEKHIPALAGELKVSDARASLRVAAKDRFPIVGALPDYQNLWISAAHGSHGLISSALAAEIIIADILDRILPMPKNVITALSAHRFMGGFAGKAKE